MGVALGDVDGDGLFDLFVTHLTEETNTLWKQGPRGLFRDRTVAAGLAAPRWRGTGFGTVLADFDHDGALDLAVVNGRVDRGAPAARRRRWGRSGAATPSATSCSPTTAAAASATCRRSNAGLLRHAERGPRAWPAATSTATAPSTCW